jgi:hypothetical protein
MEPVTVTITERARRSLLGVVGARWCSRRNRAHQVVGGAWPMRWVVSFGAGSSLRSVGVAGQ